MLGATLYGGTTKSDGFIMEGIMKMEVFFLCGTKKLLVVRATQWGRVI